MKKPTNKAERDALIKQLQAMTFNELPKRWDELGVVEGYYVNSGAGTCGLVKTHTGSDNRNLFPTSDQAEASIHLAMLLQLRDVYREGRGPDWGDYESKYCVVSNKSKWGISCRYTQERPFSFQTQERAELFFLNFEDYLERVKPLFS